MSESAERARRCPLCGHEIEMAVLPCHTGCPLGPRCGLICCPRCGYQVVDESRSVIGRLLRGRPRGTHETTRSQERPEIEVPLTHVRTGAQVEIRSLRGMAPGRSARLSAFGVVPGTHVTLVQRRPVPVIRVGETDLALSEEILAEIWGVPAARGGPSSSGHTSAVNALG